MCIKSFLRSTNSKNSFADIFNNGFYNCVSSTAMYAIIFSKLDIPYQVMEKPEHVFLIAYPETHKIFIETTSPENGYIRFSDSYVNDYVGYLYNEHVIPQRDYESKPASALFEKYYYSSMPVSLRTLVGIQYANFGMYSLDDRDYLTSAREMKKACYLEDYARNRHLLKYALTLEVGNNNYNDQALVKDLAILCRFNSMNDVDVTDQYILDEFQRLTHHQLIERSDYEKYDESFRDIIASVKDTVLNKKIAFIYHYELARLSLLEPKKDAYVKQHLVSAYLVNPEQAELHNMIISHFSRKIERSNEADKILKLTEEYAESFSFLNALAWFNAVKSNCILQLAYQNFLLANPQKAEALLKDFEAIVAVDKTVEPTEIFVEKAYSEAATYYYKKGNVKRCKEFLKKGLQYAPESFALKMRLNQT